MQKEDFEAMLEAVEVAVKHFRDALDRMEAAFMYEICDAIAAIGESCVVKKNNSKPKRRLVRSCVCRAALRLDSLPYYASGFL